MPWHVDESGQCASSEPWAVIKDADESIVACHASEADAKKQLAALYAIETRSEPVPEDDERAGLPEPFRENLVRAMPMAGFRAETAPDGRLGTLYGTLAT